ncbi:MAG: SDR family NAD(P)-dependent oxidoreductase [Labilithrix sp.]|nr:SDR family NAD(P)-dependent oxidoreductase [Labilithrix sp.]
MLLPVKASSSPLALVTGATRGIGLAIAEALTAHGLRVVRTGRADLDLERDESVDAFARDFLRAHAELDVLVDNAGASFDGFDADVARRTIQVNVLGTMRLTDALLSKMRPGGRIVMVSSGMGEVSCLAPDLRQAFLDPSLDRAGLVALLERFVDEVRAGTHAKAGFPSNAYRVSKVGLNAYTRILARELASDPRRIAVNAACPGWVRTKMGGPGAPRSPEEGARTPVWLALLPNEPGAPSGGFFRDQQPIAW